MLQNWLKPISSALQKRVEKLPDFALGANMLLYREVLPNLKLVKVAIIGVDEKSANDVREQLYDMVSPFPKDQIADLGNLRKMETSVLIPVLYELLSGKILPIVIGASDEFAKAQFLAYQDTKALVNLAVVDQKMRVGSVKETYASLFAPKRNPLLFHFSLIGFQVHQTPPDVLQFMTKNNFDTVRLGRSKAALEETEPVLRDADLLTFHLSVLKHCEAPGTTDPSPSGYFTEEACQLCRYAGMSDKLTSFGLYGYVPDRDQDQQTAKTCAQMLWYFLEGFFSRKGDYPVSIDGMTEYVVDFRRLSYQLIFWKSTRSGRWWMQVPVNTKRKHDRHRLIPCSYQDYQSACREELPDRLMQAFQRFG